MTSWVDKNGVRHFSNVEGSAEGSQVQEMEEYRSAGGLSGNKKPRDRFGVLRMYEEDRRKDYEEQNRNQNEIAKKQAQEKAAALQEKGCNEAKKKLEELRNTGWKNFKTFDADLISCPDRIWTDANGRLQDNIGECMARKNKARINAYEREMRQRDSIVKCYCKSVISG